ncbi:MAG TPA: ribbon-helix-helix protein, CopG family [Polyangia bacterium]
MPLRKTKIVFTAESYQVEAIAELVRQGGYRSATEFLRQAIDEKLDRLRRDRLAEQVERYCAAGHADEDEGLIDAQAFGEDD